MANSVKNLVMNWVIYLVTIFHNLVWQIMWQIESFTKLSENSDSNTLCQRLWMYLIQISVHIILKSFLWYKYIYWYHFVYKYSQISTNNAKVLQSHIRYNWEKEQNWNNDTTDITNILEYLLVSKSTNINQQCQGTSVPYMG